MPNRFIKFVLLDWIGQVRKLEDAIGQVGDPAARRRGLREIGLLVAWFTEVLSQPMFRGIGDLTSFPADNQVLLKREGYREVFQAYVESEASAHLTWAGGEEVFGIGQRDVATLYEFWTFVELAKIVSGICEGTDATNVLKLSKNALNVGFARGSTVQVEGYVSRLGRRLRLRLYFNRSFRRPQGAWTRPMRPDCSMELSLVDGGASLFEPMWIHFDAKYRADQLVDVLGPVESDDTEAGVQDRPIATAKTDDLLKMHAYRDAIRRSRGSYILYPGLPGGTGEQSNFAQYHEILPGVGAFPLRPSGDGGAEGSGELRQFLLRVMDHFASVLTQDRRDRYWALRAFAGESPQKQVGWEPVQGKPAADTPVLVGYVREGQLSWILRQRRYNIRAGDRVGSVGLRGSELGAELVLLYGRGIDQPQLWAIGGEPEIWSKSRMVASGYPTPRGDFYLCFPLGERLVEAVVPDSRELDRLRIEVNTASVRGQPYVVTWLDLAVRR